MPKRASRADEEWGELAERQDGVVARRQLLALGWTRAQARQKVITGRWVALRPGVYATFTGPPGDHPRLWAALLAAGDDAVASHTTSLWLAGVLDHPPDPIHLAVDAARNPRPLTGVHLHRSRVLAQARHPSARPPRTRLEVAVLDCADAARTVDDALGIVFKATQRRLTTSARLRTALEARPRHRWRGLLSQILAEVADGVASPLELRYARDVERRHGLPAGERNRAETRPSGGTWYRDVRYPAYRTVVELDGFEAHPAEHRFRDLRRDNAAVSDGDAVLRYGWRDIAAHPCRAAAQVGQVLQARGWPGPPLPCGPGCGIS